MPKKKKLERSKALEQEIDHNEQVAAVKETIRSAESFDPEQAAATIQLLRELIPDLDRHVTPMDVLERMNPGMLGESVDGCTSCTYCNRCDSCENCVTCQSCQKCDGSCNYCDTCQREIVIDEMIIGCPSETPVSTDPRRLIDPDDLVKQQFSQIMQMLSPYVRAK
ncbi:MAG: hypothetical protein QNJ97_03655 [Myxococcota bacterium]|nr:hypothetical protein [Myxococcota bacterium]